MAVAVVTDLESGAVIFESAHFKISFFGGVILQTASETGEN